MVGGRAPHKKKEWRAWRATPLFSYLTLKGSYHNSFLYLPKGELSIIHYTRTTKQNTRQAKCPPRRSPQIARLGFQTTEEFTWK